MSEIELGYERLHKNAVKCMRLASWIGTLIALVILAGSWAVMGILWEIDMPLYVDGLFLAAGVALVIYSLIAPGIRYKRYGYLIDSEKIIVVEGLWFIQKEMAPMERIHQITVKSGPIDRVYGLAKVIATTAGGTITIRFLEDALADKIAGSLQDHIRQIIARPEEAPHE